ncbi:hypothetical protein ACYOEI_39120, partial [Singulisphaera rosea]
DAVSANPVRSVRTVVERNRLNRVELFPSSLHGYKLLRLEPKVTSDISKFLEGTVKLKALEWEPRYNMTPVQYGEIQLVRPKAQDAAKKKAAEPEKAKAKEKEADPAKDEAEPAKKKGEAEPAEKKGTPE